MPAARAPSSKLDVPSRLGLARTRVSHATRHTEQRGLAQNAAAHVDLGHGIGVHEIDGEQVCLLGIDRHLQEAVDLRKVPFQMFPDAIRRLRQLHRRKRGISTRSVR